MPDLTTPPEGYTEEEWTDLSDTEREGILEGIAEPEDQKKDDFTDDELKSVIGEEEKKDDLPEVKDVKPVEKQDEKKNEVHDEHDERPVEKQGDIEMHEVSNDDLLKFRAVVTDEELKLEEVIPPELQEQLDKLKTDYDAGDMSIHDYTEAREKINRQIYKHNAGLEAEARSEAMWKKEQLFFLKAKPEYLPGQQADAAGKIRANALFGALSEMVKSLSNDEANAHLTGMQLLIKADGIVKEAFGVKPAGKNSPEKKPDEKKPAAPLPDHKTLSNIPAAANNDDDPFLQLDKLTGEAYERALERLTPEQRDAYESRV